MISKLWLLLAHFYHLNGWFISKFADNIIKLSFVEDGTDVGVQVEFVSDGVPVAHCLLYSEGALFQSSS